MIRRAFLRGLLVLVCTLAAALLLRALSGGAAQERASAGSAVAMDPAAVGLRIELGSGEDPRERWTGEISISAGQVHSVDLWEATNRSRIDGLSFDTGARQGQQLQGQNRPGQPQLFLTLTAPPQATMALNTNFGSAEFSLADASTEKALDLLNGRLRVWRAPAVVRIGQAGVDDDFPDATVAPDGSVWVAYASYRHGQPVNEEQVRSRQFDTLVPGDNGDRIRLTHYDGREWSAPLEATEALGDVWRPTVAADKKGKIWVTWSEQKENNWDLYRRIWDPAAGQWSPLRRLTEDPGADINAASTRDAQGNIWWSWQAWRGDNFGILLSSSKNGEAEPLEVANSGANEWNPSIAADSAGNVYVGWDSYENGNYDVFVRRFGATVSEIMAVASTPYYEARVSLACDPSNRLWIAYEEDEANWGKDYANADANRPVENIGAPLYLNRRIRVKTLEGSQLLAPAGSLESSYAESLERPKSFPRILADAQGNIWLAFRHHARREGRGTLWASYVTAYDGQQWSRAQLLPSSDYLIDNRPAVARWKEGGVLALYSSDARLRGRRPETDNELFATILAQPARPGQMQLASDTPSAVSSAAVHPNEKEAVARLRSYRATIGESTYQLLRGEFHRHTEHTSHRDQDGSLEDMWRYGLDAGALDWIGNGDHDNGAHREYPWWIIQKLTDIFDHPPHFMPPFTYERSLRYPDGHRNVMFAERGIRPLPRGDLSGTAEQGTPDTKLLYAYLRYFHGICASHTSGTNMGTDWRDNDPEVEPIVEIYQGHRHNYEHFGAPRGATADTQIGGYQPAGFAANAWARGYRLGVQSSSDHVSTHISYGIVFAEAATREGLLQGFRKRHCYAATDNILLDVRAGDHMMGDEFTSSKPVRLNVKVVGTVPIRRISIIKDNGYVYTTEPNQSEVEFTWQELNQPPGAVSFYYVRVEQEDGQLAWSSPIWVRYE